MTIDDNNIDPVWEGDIYSQGKHLSRYPYDSVVSFVYRYRPNDRSIEETSIVEVGCGAGNNLWFAAREGFQVAGIDGSISAIEFAKERFTKDNLEGDLQTGDFTSLPWQNESFDLALDRGALVCVSLEAAKQAVGEIRRILRPGGCFFLNVYSDRSSSARSGKLRQDGRRENITEGTLTGVGALCFYGRNDVDMILGDGWEILQISHLDLDDITKPCGVRHSEWRIMLRKSS